MTDCEPPRGRRPDASVHRRSRRPTIALELVPLCTAHIQLNPPLEVGTGPAGTRLIFEAQSAKLEGERLTAMAGAATAGWLLVGPEGTGTLDIRATFRTHDGAIIFGQYHGRVDFSDGTDLPKRIYVPRGSRRATSATSGST